MRRMKRIQGIFDVQGDNINTKKKGRNGYVKQNMEKCD